jgi:hypothetical protein
MYLENYVYEICVIRDVASAGASGVAATGSRDQGQQNGNFK